MSRLHEAEQSQLLELVNLRTYLHTSRGIIKAVDGVDIEIGHGEKVGLVGESGSGKSMTARSILRLLPEPPAKVEGGQVLYRGLDLLSIPEAEMRKIRGSEIAMVFQDPMSYLNPTMRIGDQILEAVLLHRKGNHSEVVVEEALTLVGLPPASGIKKRYPHELSGGMRQRVLLAIALACRPSLLIADEPTTALDVTIQAQILDLLDKLTKELNMSLLLITHDLGIVAELCERVYVMYAGQIVEGATTLDLFTKPAHPYTRGLLKGMLSINEFKRELQTIKGSVPDLSSPPKGCRFHPRCPEVMPICQMEPRVFTQGKGHTVLCWLYQETEPEVLQ